jgi:peptidoglycan-associated lipoprotein
MKQIAFISIIALIISGCGSKSVEQDLTKKEEKKEEKKVVVVPANEKLNKVILIDDTKKVKKDTVEVKEIDFQNDIKSIYFDTDKYSIRDDMQDVAISNYKALNGSKFKKIKLEGNCDEWGSDEYNYALGLKRAKAIKDAMIEFGLDESNFVLVTYGESNPKCNEHKKECWQQNRRVDYIKIDDE